MAYVYLYVCFCFENNVCTAPFFKYINKDFGRYQVRLKCSNKENSIQSILKYCSIKEIASIILSKLSCMLNIKSYEI